MSKKNFVSYGDAESIFTGFAADIKENATSISTHSGLKINSADGAHGLRINNGVVQYYDETAHEWKDTAGGGSGIALDDVSGASITLDKTTATIKWSDPPDVVIGGTTLSTWAGTLVVRKAGGAPSSRVDGTIVVDNTVRNAYASTGFVDSGLTYGTTYYYRFFPYNTQDLYTNGTAISVMPSKEQLAIPTVSGQLTYTGSEQTQTFTGYDSTKMTVSGNTGTLAGSYTATFTLGADCAWSDGTTGPKTVAWTIDKQAVTVPTVTDTSKTYSGSAQHPTVTGYDSEVMSRAGYEYADAGSYTLTFTLLDDDNYQWNTAGAGATVSFPWSIAKQSVNAPVLDSTVTITYDGTEKNAITLGAITGYSVSLMTATGVTRTDAGSQTATFALKDTDNYQWNGTPSVTWSVAKANGSVTLSSNSVTLDADHTSATVMISGATGAVTISSSDTGIATVSPSSMSAPGGTLTITSPNEDTGTATVTVSVAASTNYEATSDTISVDAAFVQIYGAEWDGTSTTSWSRTDAAENFTDPVPAVSNGTGSSPFDTISPWCDIKRVTDATAGELVEIPKFYYKLTQTGNKLKIQISSAEFGGAVVSPAHMDRGDGAGVRDKIYVGRYHCASDYKSKTGVKPVTNITRSTARSSIHNLGSAYYQWDFATRFTIWLLYIVEFAHWNSQEKIGYGCGNNSATENMGYTDSMQYHTGTKQASRTTYGLGTQYRYIEGLWDNVYDWLDGCYYNSSGLNLILNPANFSDSTGGTAIGTPSSGYPSKFTVSSAAGFPAFYPTWASGSDSSFSCDIWNFRASGPCLYVGGYYDQYLSLGLFYVDCGLASDSSAGRGCRLLKLP